MTPTDKEQWRFPLIPLGELAILETLPKDLSKWWLENNPDQPEVANALNNFNLDVQSRLDILQFGRYWGVLSRHYAQSLPESLKMGIAYMLANRYADLSLTSDSDFIHANQQYRESLMNRDRYVKEVQKLKKQEMQIYFNAYPIDRYAFLYVLSERDMLNNMLLAIHEL